MADISIIIPCYNVEKYLMRCFNSLSAQTIGLSNLELIFIDDASTDGTWEVLKTIEKLAPDSVCIIHLDENMRQGGARNIGLTYATSDFIGYVDSDDWVEPDMYELMLKYLQQTEADLVFCRNIRDNGSTVMQTRSTEQSDRVLYIESRQQRNDFIVSNTIGYGVWDKLYRKDFLIQNHIMFPEHLAYEDIYFGSLIYLYAHKVGILETKLYHYFINPGSTVLKKNSDYHEDIFQVNYLKWNALQERGFLNEYRESLEYDFIMTFYLAGFKLLCLRYDQIPYEDFLELKEGTLKRIPSYKQNKYLKTHVPELYQIVLELLDKPVTHSELLLIQKSFCAYYHVV